MLLFTSQNSQLVTKYTSNEDLIFFVRLLIDPFNPSNGQTSNLQ